MSACNSARSSPRPRPTSRPPPQHGRLLQFDATGLHTLASGGVNSASVAFGRGGQVLLATLTNGALIQVDAAGARTLASGVGSASVAFNGAAEVIVAALTDGTLI